MGLKKLARFPHMLTVHNGYPPGHGQLALKSGKQEPNPPACVSII